jgi:hypothetical protein
MDIQEDLHDVEYLLYKYRNQYSIKDCLIRLFNQTSFDLTPVPPDKGKWSYLQRDWVRDGVPWVSWRAARGLDPAIHPFLCLTGFSSTATSRDDVPDGADDERPFQCPFSVKDCFAVELCNQTVDLRDYANVKILSLKRCTVSHLDALTAPLRLGLVGCALDPAEFERAVGIHTHCRVLDLRNTSLLTDIRPLKVIEALDICGSDVAELPFFPTLRVIHTELSLKNTGHCHSVYVNMDMEYVKPFQLDRKRFTPQGLPLPEWFKQAMEMERKEDEIWRDSDSDEEEDTAYRPTADNEDEDSAPATPTSPPAKEDAPSHTEDSTYHPDWDMRLVAQVQELCIGNCCDLQQRLHSMDAIATIPRLALHSSTFTPQSKELIDLSESWLTTFKGHSRYLDFYNCPLLERFGTDDDDDDPSQVINFRSVGVV